MTIISDMRGPCPKEFHVPLRSEWATLIQTWITLWAWTSTWWADFAAKLKLPLAGMRYGWNSNPSSQWDIGYYYAADANADNNEAYYLEFASDYIATAWIPKASWLSIRAFRNFPVTPNNSWTTIYQWTGLAGIFHSAALGLISISADGENWITIMDKNLWASETYDSWDSLIEDTCWKYYQWGNNYWFVFLWTVNVTTIKVDTANYWPWHYYADYKFVESSWDWSVSPNNNLWGWVTQGSHEDYPEYDIDQIRRQFPQEIARYVEALVNLGFSELSWQMDQIQLAMNSVQDSIDTLENTTLPAMVTNAATSAATAAEQTFENMALSAIVAAVQPELDEYIALWVVDTRTWERYKFYVDTKANIEALTDREDNTIYIWKENP